MRLTSSMPLYPFSFAIIAGKNKLCYYAILMCPFICVFHIHSVKKLHQVFTHFVYMAPCVCSRRWHELFGLLLPPPLPAWHPYEYPPTPLPPKPAAACVGSSTDMWASWCCYLSLPPFSFSNFLQFAPYNTHLTFYRSNQNLSFFFSSTATLWFSPTCLERSLDQLCVGKCGVCDADLGGSSHVSARGTKSFALNVETEKNGNLNATTRNLSTCL